MTQPDPVARSDAFDANLEKNPLVMNLVKLTRQHSRIIKWLGFSIALDVGLSIALIVLAMITNDTAHKADAAAGRATSARTQAYLNCQAANAGREDSSKLWRFVLSFPPPPNETPAARKVRREETARFKAYVNKAFAPRDCKHPSAPPANLPFPHVSGATRHRPSSSPSSQPQQGTEAAPSSSGGAASSPQPRPAPSPSARPSSHPSSRPSPSQSPTPHPIQSCLQHPVKCVPLNGATVAGGTGGPSGEDMTITAAACLLTVVAAAWWRCVSPRFRAPPSRTLRRSAD